MVVVIATAMATYNIIVHQVITNHISVGEFFKE
jgi:hypothetical protein